MQPSYFRQTCERGFILVTLPVILLILIGLIGLAVDAGRLYITQQELQASADAAVRSSLGARVAENNPGMLGNNFNEQDYIRDRVEVSFFSNLAERNILRNGSPSSGGRALQNEDNFIFFEDEDDGSLTLVLEPVVQVSTMLVHLILPNNNGVARNNVQVRSTSRIEPANIVFIVDLSESSSCPESGTCNCNGIEQVDADGNPFRDTCRAEAARAGPDVSLRYERIREALLNFLQGFDDSRDRIAMVFFNNVAWTVVEFKGIGAGGIPERGFDPDEFRVELENIFERKEVAPPGSVVPIGNTNITDGLLVAFEHAHESGFIDQEIPVSYILLTDGAPTAASLVLDNGEDVLVFGVEWSEVTPTFTSRHSGPGHFVKRQDYREEYLENQNFKFNAPLTVNLDPWGVGDENSVPDPFLHTRFLADCHQADTDPDTARLVADMPGDNGRSEDRLRAFGACLDNTWSSRLPCPLNVNECPRIGQNLDLATSLHDPFFAGETIGPRTAENSYRQIFYISAIEAANMMRERGGILYTVGWGGIPVFDPLDPFQTILDEGNLKPYFLSNLANDYYNATSINEEGVVTPLHPEFPDETQSYQDKKEGGQSIGAFYQAPDAQAVETALNLIARQIKLRLIQ
jgi:hypothetical protein